MRTSCSRDRKYWKHKHSSEQDWRIISEEIIQLTVDGCNYHCSYSYYRGGEKGARRGEEEMRKGGEVWRGGEEVRRR